MSTPAAQATEIALACLALLTGCAIHPTPPPSPRPNAAWDAAFTRTSGWNGGDVASSVSLPDGRTLWFFGDSFIGPVKDGRRAEGTRMIRNAAAWHATPPNGTPPDDIHFLTGPPDDDGHATSWLDPANLEPAAEPGQWYWPMGGALLAPGPDRLVFFATRFGPSGNPDGVWNFRRTGGVLCVVDNWQDHPDSWRIRAVPNPHVTPAPAHAEASRPSVNWGAALLRRGPDCFIFGIQENTPQHKQLVLARAACETLDRPETWQFYSALGWAATADDLAILSKDVPDEFSTASVGTGKNARLILISNEWFFGHRIMARAAHNPWGPWSPPVPLFTVPGLAADRRLMTYAHKAHPHLSAKGELLVTYVINSSDFGQVLGDVKLYRPRFVSIPITSLPAVPK